MRSSGDTTVAAVPKPSTHLAMTRALVENAAGGNPLAMTMMAVERVEDSGELQDWEDASDWQQYMFERTDSDNDF
jgi:hypothetical protein